MVFTRMACVAFLVLAASGALAQTPLRAAAATPPPGGPQPEAVPALASILEQGIHPRFLKHDATMGLDVWWLPASNGQPRPIYTTPDGRFLLIAMVFDGANASVPMLTQEVAEITAVMTADGTLPAPAPTDFAAAAPATSVPSPAPAESDNQTAVATQPPAGDKAKEVLRLLASAPTVLLGRAGAPVVYAVVDPQCPYCERFYRTIKPAVDAGQVQLRLIVTAALHGSAPITESLLSAADYSAAWTEYMNSAVLPQATATGGDMVTRTEQTRLALDRAIGGSGVPLIIYQSKSQHAPGFFRGVKAEQVAQIVADAAVDTSQARN
jgi:protein-disulfide isomerase